MSRSAGNSDDLRVQLNTNSAEEAMAPTPPLTAEAVTVHAHPSELTTNDIADSRSAPGIELLTPGKATFDVAWNYVKRDTAPTSRTGQYNVADSAT